jgi:hypothetical protein
MRMSGRTTTLPPITCARRIVRPEWELEGASARGGDVPVPLKPQPLPQPV